MATTSIIIRLLQDAFLVCILFIVGALFLATCMHAINARRWNSIWRWVERNLTWMFIVVWIAGFCIYCTGMYIVAGTQGDFLKLTLVAMMAVIHAFGMFVLDSDISAVHEEFHNSLFYMTLFSTVHFLAAFLSMIFVIKHFGYNIVAGVHLWLTAHLSRHRDDLYIFWGINQPSYYLAKDIQHNAQGSYRVLFVKTADDENGEGNRTGIDRLLSFLSVKNRELREFKELACLSTNAFTRLSKCQVDDEEWSSGTADVLKKKLGLKSIVKLLGKTSRHVHVLMLGEDEDSNIKAAENLMYDRNLRGFVLAAKEHRVTIHCHARYDSVNRILENTQYENGLEIHIVDSAHMAIETLKGSREPLCLPVDYVDVEKDATVSGTFRSMVIGMGECGRDAVRFLYEYGAFVRKGSNGEQSDFRCDVFDKDMDTIAPSFFNARQGVDVSTVNESLDGSDCCHRVNLYKADTEGQLFWDFADGNISRQNCIFISTNDDEAGMTLAILLLKLAIRKCADLERLRIFVRSYSEVGLQHMERIARHYNESVVRSLGLQRNRYPIYIFGKMRDLYTWQHIIDDNMRKESYRYYDCYNDLVETEEHLGDAWKKERTDILGRQTPYEYGKLNSVRRIEFQNMENTWHRLTKIRLILRSLDGDETKLRTQSGDDWQRIMDTLAQTEHLRWNASHEMLGYTYDKDITRPERDIRMKHNYITSWEDLDTVTRSYDYRMVETSIRMYLMDIQG